MLETNRDFYNGYQAGLRSSGVQPTPDAGDIVYDPDGEYDNGTVGKALQSITAEDVSFDDDETYSSGTVGKELANVKNQLEDLNECNVGESMAAKTTASGWRLNDNGLCSSNAGYKLVKYNVTEGLYYAVHSDDKFQFQNAETVPSSGANKRVGSTYGAGDYVLKAPETATFLIISTPTSGEATASYTLKSMVNKIDKTLKSALTDEVWRNGTPGNTGNTNYICLNGYIPNKTCKFYHVKTQIELEEDMILRALLYTKNSSGNTVRNEYTIETESNEFDVVLRYSEESFTLALTTVKNDVVVPLRIGTTDADKIVILPTYLQKNLSPLEICAFIGNNGQFLFKDYPVFSGGKCAFRLSANLNILEPGKTPVYYSTDEILSDLSSDDKITDGDTTWICLRGQRSLIYDFSDSKFKTDPYYAAINGNQVPILVQAYNQFIGGLIFDKYQEDVRNLSRSIDGVRAYAQNSRKIYNNAGTPLTLLHISDIHADVSALSRIASQKNALGSLVDDAICTGDIVSNTGGSISSWWDASIMTCIGNHDTATYDGSFDWTAVTMANRDAYYIAPFESNWGITHTSGTSYYYKDYATQKVRLIVIDAMLYMGMPGEEATAQTSWLAGLLSDAITNNLHVLIATHSGHGGATVEECSFSQRGISTFPVYSDCDTPQTIIDTVATAITGGLKFIGYLCGHEHKDLLLDAENDGTQMMYCITCANSTMAQRSDMARGSGLDAYNLVTIDTENTLVKIVRGGGADFSNSMRTRKAICFDYSTGTKVGEVL